MIGFYFCQMVNKLFIVRRVHFSFLLLCCLTSTVAAFDELSINIENIDSQAWQIHGVKLALLDLDEQGQRLVLSVDQLTLPEPLSTIHLIDINCLSFSWEDKQLLCEMGKAKFKSSKFSSPPFDFSFSVAENQNTFRLKNLNIAKGYVSINAREHDGSWLIKVNAKNVLLAELKQLFPSLMSADLTHGSIDLNLNLKGNRAGLNGVDGQTIISQLSMQANKGKMATESLDVSFNLQAKKTAAGWQWQNTNQISQGEFYYSPVYLELNKQGISIQSKGFWNQNSLFKIYQAQVILPHVVELNAKGDINTQAGLIFDKTNISADIADVGLFNQLFVSPFLEQTGFEGIHLKGKLNTQVKINQSSINQVFVTFNKLGIRDDNKRLAIDNAAAKIYWSKTQAKASFISWQQLKIKAIPIDEGELKFTLSNQAVTLLQKSKVPLLDGVLEIKQFSWKKDKADEPEVFFAGEVQELSLEKLSKALDWTPLTGHISGSIPGVDYANKTLTLKGQLDVNVFDGLLSIKKLSSSGMFTNFAKLHLDMTLDQLDLYALTQKFKMGAMEGRVSGFVTDLYLENWSPVTFYAWLGTPDNDDSRHRISQKAVENIASVGGGGAADVISKGFLRFFDTFGYDRLGFGCYLHQGVCQLMGVEAAEQGYYIIKGGGIPRIDVIGYNPQVDWVVLMDRLSRVTMNDEVLIE